MSWTKSKGIPKGAVVTALVQDTTRFSTVHVGLSSSPGYLRSDDGGKSFFAPGNGPGGITSLVACKATPTRLYASLASHEVVRSDNLGKTWRSTAMRGYPKSEGYIWLSGDPSDMGRLYLLSPGEPCLWRSNDSAETWTRMDRGIPSGGSFREPTLAVTRRGRKLALLGAERAVEIKPGEDRWRETLPTNLENDLPAEAILADTHRLDTLWHLRETGLWRRDNGGLWNRVSRIKGRSLHDDAQRRGWLVVADASTVSLSRNDGRSWRILGGKSFFDAIFSGDNVVARSSTPTQQALWWRKL